MSKVKDRVLLSLAASSYRPALGTDQSGAPAFAHIPPEHWNAHEVAITPEMLDTARNNLEARGVTVPPVSSGFSGHLYMVKHEDGSHTPVIAYRGTDNLPDIAPDLALSLGNANVQFANLLLFYEAAKIAISQDALASQKDLVFTGHSLGGGLAALIADYTGHEAVTVNPAPSGYMAEHMRRGLYVESSSSPLPLTMPLGGATLALRAGEALYNSINTSTANGVSVYPVDGQKPADFASWYIPPSTAPEGHVRNVVYRGEILDYLNQDMKIPFAKPYFEGETRYSNIPMDGNASLIDLHSAYLAALMNDHADIFRPLAEKMPELITQIFNPAANRVDILNEGTAERAWRSDRFIQQLLRDDFPNGNMSKAFLADLNTIAIAADTLKPEVREAMVQVAIHHAVLQGDKGPQAAGESIISSQNGSISIDLTRFPATDRITAIETLRPVLLADVEASRTLPVPEHIIVSTTPDGTALNGTTGNDWIIGSKGADQIAPLSGNDVVLADRSDRILVTPNQRDSRRPEAYVGQGTIVAAGMSMNTETGNLLVLSDKLGDNTRQAPMVIAPHGKPLERVLPASYREMTQGSDLMGERGEVVRIAIERTGFAHDDPRNDLRYMDEARTNGSKLPTGHLLILADGSVQGPENGGISFGNNPQIAAGKNGETLGILYAGTGAMTPAQMQTMAQATSWLNQQRQAEGLSSAIEVIAGSTATAELLSLPTPRGPLPANTERMSLAPTQTMRAPANGM